MFISEIAEKIEREINKLQSEWERRTAYQDIIFETWFGGYLTKKERDILNTFLTELVSAGKSFGDFNNKDNSFFCKNNVTGEEEKFYSLFEWSEWFKKEKNYSDKFSIYRPEWKYEKATLALEWFGEWREDGSYETGEKWAISNLPDNVVKEWVEFISELTLRANAA